MDTSSGALWSSVPNFMEIQQLSRHFSQYQSGGSKNYYWHKVLTTSVVEKAEMSPNVEWEMVMQCIVLIKTTSEDEIHYLN